LAAPELFVEHLIQKGYDSRSSKHSNILMKFIVDDLVRNCAAIRELAEKGKLVYKINYTAQVQNEDWKIDLALGPPLGPRLTPISEVIAQQQPAAVRIGVEAKSIMTKHIGQRKNRRRDVGAFRDFMDNLDPRAVRAAITIVNMSTQFRSPLTRGITPHPNIEKTVEEIATIFRNVILRPSDGGRGTVDANCIIVVDYDNIDKSRTVLVTRRPAPQEGDPLHYSTFLQRICDAFVRRWGTK